MFGLFESNVQKGILSNFLTRKFFKLSSSDIERAGNNNEDSELLMNNNISKELLMNNNIAKVVPKPPL